MVLSGLTLSAKLSSTTLKTLVKALRLWLTSASDDTVLAAEAPVMLGPNIPPAMVNKKMIAPAIQVERRLTTAKGYILPASSIGQGSGAFAPCSTDVPRAAKDSFT